MTANSRKTIGIYFPYFMGGGAEAVGLWMLEALKKHYDLTLFTFTPVNWTKLNLMYGTSLSSEQIQVKSVLPSFTNSLSNFFIANNPHVRQFSIHTTLRLLKNNSSNYDLMISGFNAADLGINGIQYIHWPKVLEGGKLAPTYNKISEFSQEQAQKNLSLVNSAVVACAAKDAYGVDSIIVYPPVVIAPRSETERAAEDIFICSGRLVKSKEPHKVINILQKVREKGYNIKLYITGGGGGFAERNYENMVRKMAKENAEWVTLYSNLSYEDYTNLLYRCKYGIHFKTEPFGIVIAEMLKAGCIPFVKSQGGQTEIVGQHNTELFFDSEEEAVAKIISVLENPELQNRLINLLKEQQNLFSSSRFSEEIIDLVEQYFLHKNSSTKI
jgi:glycosyltransferase involved in cell wall biosynthesis